MLTKLTVRNFKSLVVVTVKFPGRIRQSRAQAER